MTTRWTCRTAACLLGLALWTLTGAGRAEPAPTDPEKPHHGPQGFRNLEPYPQSRWLELLRWRWESWRDGRPARALTPAPRVAPELDFLQANARAGAHMTPTATWVGHSTVLVQMAGLNLLTDPMWSERASPVSWAGPKRMVAPGVAMHELPTIDLVLISHNHYDHLDEATVRALNAQAGGPPLFIVPLGLAAWMQGVGVSRVVELDWWERHTVRTTRGEAEVMLTPARHWSARTLLGDRMQSLWGGFAVLSPSFHLYYSGDTGYDGQFKTIAQRLAPEQGPKGFDLALIPIGAYLPRWFMQPQHVDPTEAVQIHQDVRSQRSLGVHWGTFDLGDEPTDQAPQDLALARQAKGLEPEAFKVLAVGQTWRLPRRR